MTELGDKILLAYVDGQLARKQSRAVEKVLEQDDVIAVRVEALQDGRRRLEAAFDAILAGELSEVSKQSIPGTVKGSKARGFRDLLTSRVVVGAAGIVIAIAAAANYDWAPEIPSKAASTNDVEPTERLGSFEQVQVNIAAVDAQLGTTSGTRIVVAVPDASTGLSKSEHFLPPAEDLATAQSDHAIPYPEAETGEGISADALVKQGAVDKTKNEGLVVDAAQDNTPAAKSLLDAAGVSSHEQLSGAEVETQFAATNDDSNGGPDRVLAASEAPSTDPAAPNPAELKAGKLAAAEALGSSATSPRNSVGNEMLDPITHGENLALKAAKGGQPHNEVKRGDSQQPLERRAMKTIKHEATATAKKALTHKVKQAAPLKTSAAKSHRKVMMLGKAEGALPAQVSPRRSDVSAYAQTVRATLSRHKPKSVDESGSVTVSFAIGRSGELRNARITRSSGKKKLDQAALATLRKAATFPPPAGRSQPSYSITIDFR